MAMLFEETGLVYSSSSSSPKAVFSSVVVVTVAIPKRGGGGRTGYNDGLPGGEPATRRGAVAAAESLEQVRLCMCF